MRRLGLTDLQVYELCLGGNVFGWTIGRERSFEVLDGYVEAGGNFIDTADAYSQWVPGHEGGESETVIGEWLGSRGHREDLILMTKVGNLNSHKGLTKANILAAVDESLRRLQTDYLDVYCAHWDDNVTPIEQIHEAFDAVVVSGKVRYVGASNFEGSRRDQLVNHQRATGEPWLALYQAEYNLVERQPFEGELRPLLKGAGTAGVPFYALASGFLSGKYRPGRQVAGARSERASGYLADPRNLDLLSLLDEVSHRHGASPTAVALAWLRDRPGVAVPIASATSLEQLAQLLDGSQLVLEGDELAELELVSSRLAS